MHFFKNVLLLFGFLLGGFQSKADLIVLDSLLEKIESISVEQHASDLTSLYVTLEIFSNLWANTKNLINLFSTLYTFTN